MIELVDDSDDQVYIFAAAHPPTPHTLIAMRCRTTRNYEATSCVRLAEPCNFPNAHVTPFILTLTSKGAPIMRPGQEMYFY